MSVKRCSGSSCVSHKWKLCNVGKIEEEEKKKKNESSPICCYFPLQVWGLSFSNISDSRQSTNHWVIFHHQLPVSSTPVFSTAAQRHVERRRVIGDAADITVDGWKECTACVTAAVWASAEKENIALIWLLYGDREEMSSHEHLGGGVGAGSGVTSSAEASSYITAV